GIIGIFAYRIVTGWYAHASWMIIKWLPVVLSPLLLAQLYSTEGGVNLRVLFLFKRKKKPSDTERKLLVDLSYPFFAICLLAAGAANHRTLLFYIGICILFTWTLWVVRPKKRSLKKWAILLLITGGCGYGIQFGLASLQGVITEAGMNWFVNFLQKDRDPYRAYTHMGEIGEIKLSSRVVFRVKPGGWDPGSLLLREASYDKYLSGAANWAASNRNFSSIAPVTGGGYWKILPDSQPDKTCTVSMPLNNGKGLLKLPNGTTMIGSLEMDRMQRSPLGSVKVEGKGLVTYAAHYSSKLSTENPPSKEDLSIPNAEAATIQQIVSNLKLETLTSSEVLNAVSRFFKNNFSYSLEQKSLKGNGTVIENFLTKSRTGHCEFFASAAVLLLRGVGIPARYVTGYAVDTWDKMGEWILVRSQHAHSWAHAYVNGHWVDLDTTPGVWLEVERSRASPWRRIGDLWSWMTFGFSKWRWRQDASAGKTYLILVLLPLVVIMLVRILSKKRGRKRIPGTEKNEKDLKDIRSISEGFSLIEERLKEMGFYRQEWETVACWIDRLELSKSVMGNIETLRQIKDFHYRYRYYPQAFTVKDEEQMSSLVKKWLEPLKDPLHEISRTYLNNKIGVQGKARSGEKAEHTRSM
ncbi:MAG: transglutaminase domain-containing protein, partial [Desulfobacterales bacterium]